MGKVEDFRSPVAITRIATVLLGIVIMGVGLHSHFESAWTADARDPFGNKVTFRDVACGNRLLDYACPSYSLETYYVAMVIITFMVSLALLVTSFFIDMRHQPYKSIDLGYHAIAGVLLLIGAIVYFVSAVQIDKLTENTALDWDGLLRDEKFAAASLTIIQCLLFGVLALLVGRGGK